MLTCDLIVAAKGAKIGIREVKVDCSRSRRRVPTACKGWLRESHGNVLTGEPITAEEALDAGLLSSLTEAGEALPAALH